MTRFEAWTTHTGTLLVGGTGLAYAWMRYLMHPADPFAVVNHPLQPFVQHLHILVAPLLVFAAGVMWHQHAWGVLAARREAPPPQRRLPAAHPGAHGGLGISAADRRRRRLAADWAIVHLATSGLWLLGYLAHQLPVLRKGLRPYLRPASLQR